MKFNYYNFEYSYNGYTVESHESHPTNTFNGVTYGSVVDTVTYKGKSYTVIRRFKIIDGTAIPSDWLNGKPALAMYSADLSVQYKVKRCIDGKWFNMIKPKIVCPEGQLIFDFECVEVPI